MNKIKKIQEMLYEEMERLSDDEIIKSYAKREVSRSQALTQSAGAYIKALNTQIRIKEIARNTSGISEDTLLQELGVINEEKTEQ